jgi:hypothetical protein
LGKAPNPCHHAQAKKARSSSSASAARKGPLHPHKAGSAEYLLGPQPAPKPPGKAFKLFSRVARTCTAGPWWPAASVQGQQLAAPAQPLGCPQGAQRALASAVPHHQHQRGPLHYFSVAHVGGGRGAVGGIVRGTPWARAQAAAKLSTPAAPPLTTWSGASCASRATRAAHFTMPRLPTTAIILLSFSMLQVTTYLL